MLMEKNYEMKENLKKITQNTAEENEGSIQKNKMKTRNEDEQS